MHNRGFRPELPPALYPSLAKLIRDCWSAKPEDRPSFSEIVRRLRGDVSMEVMTLKEPVILKSAEIDAGLVVDENDMEEKTLEQENDELKERIRRLEDVLVTNRIKI